MRTILLIMVVLLPSSFTTKQNRIQSNEKEMAVTTKASANNGTSRRDFMKTTAGLMVAGWNPSWREGYT